MAYILKNIGNAINVPLKHFECDNISDLSAINTNDVLMGSTCYVINTDTSYTLNSNKEWKVRSQNSGGGGGNVVTASSVVATSVVLPSTNWEGNASPYSQVVTIDGVTPTSKIDLQPTTEQIDYLTDEEIILTVANNVGVVTVYAIGGKPDVDLTLQATITEVVTE